MSQRPLALICSLVGFVLLTASIARTVHAQSATPTAVPLDETDDILDGTTYLVRADDLIVGDPYMVMSSQTQVQWFRLETDDMMITDATDRAAFKVVEPSCIASSSSNTPFPQQTQLMRMFNLPNDVVVTLAPTAGIATGSGCSNGAAGAMTFYVDDQVANKTYETPVPSFGIQNGWLHTAVADFDGDGFDDLFFNTDLWTYVATAHDTDSPSSGIDIVVGLQTGGSRTPMADPTVGDFNADGNLDVAWMGTGFSSGNKPVVHFATVCAGPIDGTICAAANPFDIILSTATISPSAPSGSIVTVGGPCTQNSNNQVNNELRAPAMAVAAGQYDTATAGDELVVVSLYEDPNKKCIVVADSYNFTTAMDLTPAHQHQLDNLGPHEHISTPAAIYATAGMLDWSDNQEHVAIAISGGKEHNVLVISLTDSLVMTSEEHKFSIDNNKSFGGLAVGRFSSAPEADASTSCTAGSGCTDTCFNNVCVVSGSACTMGGECKAACCSDTCTNELCELSGFDCTADGDCTGSCTTDGVCSYIKPNNYNLQIAVFLMAHSSSHGSELFIYTADKVDAFTPQQIQQFTVDNFEQLATNRAIRAGSLLRAGDLQGRSQRLGSPSVVRIQKTSQPDVILEAPPAHADWLPMGELPAPSDFCSNPNDCAATFNPSNACNCDLTTVQSESTCEDGTELRCLVNFSAIPGTYNSEYAFMEMSSEQSSRMDTTSYSLGVSVDLSEKTKSLTPSGNVLTQKTQFSAENTYNHSVVTNHSSYKTNSYNGSTTTGFHDVVWYTARDYNVYFYPVIGQTICVDTCLDTLTCSISGGSCQDDSDCEDVCQDGTCSTTAGSCGGDAGCPGVDPTDCPDADMQQLYVQYSGASSVKPHSDSAASLEWYQPVHEPGQILSYPWDCAELASRYGVSICEDQADDDDYSLLAETTSFSTGDIEQTFSMDWTVGKGSSRTASKGGQFSQALTQTVTYGTNSLESEVEGVKLKASATYNASESISTAKTNTTSMGSSTGVSIALPGSFLDTGNLAYPVVGYVFGDAPTKGTLQQLTPTNTGNVEANGVMRTAFTADPPLTSNEWWGSSPYSRNIDVALNRPLHLDPMSSKGISDPSVTQCRSDSETNAVNEICVTYDPADSTPTGYANSNFYYLRGFFITPADAAGQGPQLTLANQGDVLALQVRVYNYSLRDMDASSTIQVDFFAQEWDAVCSAPAGYYDHTPMLTCTQTGGAVVHCDSGPDACDACCITNQPVDSVKIGRASLAPLPGFNSTVHVGESNWALATMNFDTGDPMLCGNQGCGDKYFMFWVVVWPEGQDVNQNPVLFAELPGHSLTRIPPDPLKSIADLCPKSNECIHNTCLATRGTCTTNSDCPTAADNKCKSGTCTISGVACAMDSDCGDCLCEVCIDEFSNNVGLFNQEFYIAPANQVAGPEGELEVSYVTVSPPTVQVGEKVIVAVGLRAVGGKIDGQFLRFHAVPPDSADLTVEEVFAQIGGFDAENVSRIRADSVHQVKVPFFPQTLGSYEILVSTVVDGEQVLLGTAELQVGDGPPATPTMPVPPATPTAEQPQDSDDSCAIVRPSGPSWKGLVVLLLVPVLLGLLRFRRARGRGPSRR